jgi:ABC-type polysaccharide/polyol phosphate transport system ATPase subunit/2-polyprenyl-3-methyl-5-hydroxy-6-metoxy-1,4-benzoquinol methylase
VSPGLLAPGEIRATGLGRRFKVRSEDTRSLKEVVLRRHLPETREFWALRDVDLHISPGETFGVVGRNGSGKSTLLNLMSRIYAPSEGDVEVGGRIGTLLEVGAGFHPEFTGVENVYLSGAIHGLDRGYVREHLDEILAFAELEEFAHMPVKTYSSGMYLRLGFSVAIHVQPNVLLVDESLAVGDEAFQEKCFGRIEEFRRDGGTLVFVSHDPNAVTRLCDRAILLEHGRMVKDDRADDVLRAYHASLAGPVEIRDGRYAGEAPRAALTLEDVALALRNPAAARRQCVIRAWPEQLVKALGADTAPIRIVPPEAPLRLPTARNLWSGAMETTVLDTAEDLISLLNRFQPESLESHVALLPEDAMRLYLRMNVVRVVRLVELLQRRGVTSGKVLEVGAWFGSFSLALRRLGYDVVACDRYSSYGDAFRGHVELMQEAGVRVVSTRRGQELEEIRGLGRFDVVLAAAVIEHIPHTPRPFLETLFDAVRPGGLLVLDTPNVARYWSRRALERGNTIFQPLEDQFGIEPPWEGHHREFTAPELHWMLEEVGCDQVEVEFLDYNMLQFDELSAEHIDCLATIVEDPGQSDTILAAGTRPGG